MKRFIIYILSIFVLMVLSSPNLVLNGRSQYYVINGINTNYIRGKAEVNVSIPQNLIFYSEQIDNWTVAGSATVTANQGVDGNGQNTLEQVTMSAVETWIHYDITTNISINTNYTISIEAYGNQCSTLEIQGEILGGSVLTLTAVGAYTEDYGNSLTGSVVRYTYTFTTPASLGSGLRISIVHFPNSVCNGISFYIGRIWLTEGDADFRSATWQYVVTTDTQITGD